MDDVPRSECADCTATFYVVWDRNPAVTEGVAFCPFCGSDDIETEEISDD